MKEASTLSQLITLAWLTTSTILTVATVLAKICTKTLYDRTIGPLIIKSKLKHQLATTSDYSSWCDIANELDELEGANEWKEQLESNDYDYRLIKSRVEQLKNALQNDNINSMKFLLRTNLTRNIADIGNTLLFSRSRIGTKKLIEEYLALVEQGIECIASGKCGDHLEEKIDFFRNLQRLLYSIGLDSRMHGNTALLLSGGATIGLIHSGVVITLFKQGLLPRIVSGSSAGAIVAALACTRTDDEMMSLLDFEKLNLVAFGELFSKDERPSLLAVMRKKIERWLRHGVLYDAETLKQCLKKNLGNVTFLEAFNRTRRILNVTVSSNTVYDVPRLLNYLTAPNVVIWSAVLASCAIPAFYSSCPLYAKDRLGNLVLWDPTSDTFIDGSVENDLPIRRLSELLNVNHYIVAQVNPHVYWFIQTKQRSFMDRMRKSFLFLINTELTHRITQLLELGIKSRWLHAAKSVLVQNYYGDITIVPELSLKDFLLLLSNVSPTELKSRSERGIKATFPFISIIASHTCIEKKLDSILYRLRCRIIDKLHIDKSVSEMEVEEHDFESAKRRSFIVRNKKNY